MITASEPGWQSDGWRRLLAEAVTDPRELLERLDLADDPLMATIDPRNPFPVRVPQPLLARMRRGDPDDPILRQVLASADERADPADFVTDPLGEAAANPVPGLLHKYRGRALLIATGGCAVHCRYCFRRHFPYADNNPGLRGLEPALDHLRRAGDVSEIILSGGDPLLLDDDALARLLARLEAIPSLTRLRIHTRFPVVIPQRLTSALGDLLADSRLRCAFVLHANHARELGDDVEAALEVLRSRRIALLNQTVLLRGVNDSVSALRELSERLFDLGITPYYLHLLDRVRGAAHFEVPEEEARALYDELASGTPGYLVPRLARERPGAPGKSWLPPRW
jgi:EF-P beta-lysylation protein EpmB